MKNTEVLRSPQAEFDLAARVRWIVSRLAGSQLSLAEVMGVKRDRVQSLALGRAKNLRPDEVHRLQVAYSLRPEWLHKGEGQPTAEPKVVEQSESSVVPYDVETYRRAVEAVTVRLQARSLALDKDHCQHLYQSAYALFKVHDQASADAHLDFLIKLTGR